MQEVTFTLRTLTPLFLAGADQTKEKVPYADTFPEEYQYAWKLNAELRPPSFRGNMRYWLRALVGGAKTLQEVIQVENSVFGATDTCSAVTIKVRAPSGEPEEFTEEISFRVGGKWQATGKGYLLWSMAESGKKHPEKYKLPRWYFPTGTDFTLILSARDQDEIQLKRAIAALWLLAYLGSIGSRSRRCAGSLTVENIQAYTVQALKEQLEQGEGITLQNTEGNTSKLSFQKPETADALKTQLEEGIRSARLLFDIDQPSTLYNTQFDVLAPGACNIWMLQDKGKNSWLTPEKAMEDIGNSLQKYRGSIHDLRQREIFGLPLGKNESRRASPLHLRIIELQRGKYVGVAVLFKTIGKDTSTGRNITMNDYKRIEDWITDSNFPGALDSEVKL